MIYYIYMCLFMLIATLRHLVLELAHIYDIYARFFDSWYRTCVCQPTSRHASFVWCESISINYYFIWPFTVWYDIDVVCLYMSYVKTSLACDEVGDRQVAAGRVASAGRSRGRPKVTQRFFVTSRGRRHVARPRFLRFFDVFQKVLGLGARFEGGATRRNTAAVLDALRLAETEAMGLKSIHLKRLRHLRPTNLHGFAWIC